MKRLETRDKMTSPGIVAVDLEKTYEGRVKALDKLSFEVPRSSIFGLLGPNGAGKSTAIKILTTLARPDGGRAVVAGIDVAAAPERVRRLIGVVGQRSGADPNATGRENLWLQGRVFGASRPTVRSRVDELLERFGLSDAANRRIKTYSGGMQRRLDIAIGMIHRPQVLFLDEPTTGLDPEVRAEMWNEISRLSAEGMTVLLTTHYLEEADRLADHLLIIDQGRLVAGGTPDELKAQLKGDAIAVELVDTPDEHHVRSVLNGSDGVSEVSFDGRNLYARAATGATAVPPVLTSLEAAGIRVASVTVSRPSLDDVYLRHTGRAYASANAKESDS